MVISRLSGFSRGLGKPLGKARKIEGISGKQPDSAVPSGLVCSDSVPGIKMPGYFREVPPGLRTPEKRFLRVTHAKWGGISRSAIAAGRGPALVKSGLTCV